VCNLCSCPCHCCSCCCCCCTSPLHLCPALNAALLQPRVYAHPAAGWMRCTVGAAAAATSSPAHPRIMLHLQCSIAICSPSSYMNALYSGRCCC
jgi:hypothetical protein